MTVGFEQRVGKGPKVQVVGFELWMTVSTSCCMEREK